MNLNAPECRSCILPTRTTSLSAKPPDVIHEAYTESRLTAWQTGGVVLTLSFVVALLSRPLTHMSKFYFLSYVPGALLTPSGRPLDKRAHFMHTFARTRWWTGPPLLATTVEFATTLGVYVHVREWVLVSRYCCTGASTSESRIAQDSDKEAVFPAAHAAGANALRPTRVNAGVGCVAGAMSGLVYALLRYPFDTLSATAQAMRAPPHAKSVSSARSVSSSPSVVPTGRPRQTRVFGGGAGEVLLAALRDRPAMLCNIYQGVSAVALGKSLQMLCCFGCYHALRYDGVYRGTTVLFGYCYLGAVAGLAAQYPCLALRQQLRARNAVMHGPPMSYRDLLREMRRRHGWSKVYDGFFRTKPFLSALAPALLLTWYDMATRRLTERLYPECNRRHAHHSQSALFYPVADYVEHMPDYEFASSTRSRH